MESKALINLLLGHVQKFWSFSSYTLKMKKKMKITQFRLILSHSLWKNTSTQIEFFSVFYFKSLNLHTYKSSNFLSNFPGNIFWNRQRKILFHLWKSVISLWHYLIQALHSSSPIIITYLIWYQAIEMLRMNISIFISLLACQLHILTE